MAAEPTAITNPPAPDAQAPASPAVQAAEPAPAGDDGVSKSDMERLRKHLDELKADNAKYRQRENEKAKERETEKAALEAKLKEQGDYVRLYDSEKEKRTALEAQIADLAPKAQRLTAHEQRIADKLTAAKAKGDLPSHIVRAIDIAAKVDVDEAFDILSEHLASIGTGPAPKQPAPPAPPQGGAPASPPAKKRLEDLTTAEIHQLKAEGKLAELLGQGSSTGERPPLFRRFFA